MFVFDYGTKFYSSCKIILNKYIFNRKFDVYSIRNGTSIQMHMYWTTIIDLALESLLRPRLVGHVVPQLSFCNMWKSAMILFDIKVSLARRIQTICDRQVSLVELSKGQRRMETTK